MGIRRRLCWAIIPASRDGRRMSITATSLRPFAWWWKWRCRQVTALHPKYAQPGLWAWLDTHPQEQWPQLLRGDISWGTERMMQEAEQRALPYSFKLKKTAKVKRHIDQLWSRQDWVAAGAGWEGLSSQLQLTGWSQKRRVVILRRRLREAPALGPLH